MNKGSKMQKRLINTAICALAVSMATQAFAQQAASQPQANNNPQQNSQQVPSNPFGSVPPSGNSPVAVNYNPSGNNLDGNKTVIPSSAATAAANQGIPNPAMAAQAQGVAVPSQAPSGLPQDSYNAHQNGQNIDPVEATINILNTPDSKIRQLNRDLYNKGRVINETPTTPPRSVNDVVTASLAPGATPPVVRLAKNRTTAIIITDMTGQPWPIINYDGLSDEDFTVKRLDNPAPDGYVLSVTPKGAFVSGNLEIVLKGLPSPISIDFVSAQKEVDARKEIRVQAKGPNTQFTTIGMPESLDTTLLSILQGVAPQGAKSLTVSSAAVQAWLSRDGSSMYLRTRYKIMSPAFENVTSSPDGTFAYKMVPVPVVLYKASEGRFGEFSVDGF
jgi:intracellular multiplication protein IcmK